MSTEIFLIIFCSLSFIILFYFMFCLHKKEKEKENKRWIQFLNMSKKDQYNSIIDDMINIDNDF